MELRFLELGLNLNDFASELHLGVGEGVDKLGPKECVLVEGENSKTAAPVLGIIFCVIHELLAKGIGKGPGINSIPGTIIICKGCAF